MLLLITAMRAALPTTHLNLQTRWKNQSQTDSCWTFHFAVRRICYPAWLSAIAGQVKTCFPLRGLASTTPQIIKVPRCSQYHKSCPRTGWTSHSIQKVENKKGRQKQVMSKKDLVQWWLQWRMIAVLAIMIIETNLINLTVTTQDREIKPGSVPSAKHGLSTIVYFFLSEHAPIWHCLWKGIHLRGVITYLN